MKRPLVPVALCYAGGLLLAEAVQPSLPILFAAAFTLLALALGSARWRPVLLWPLVVVIGWTNLVSRTAVLSQDDLREVMVDSAALVSVRGTLAETPSVRTFKQGALESSHTLALVNVTGLARGTNWQSAGGRIMVSTPGGLPDDLFAGQDVEIYGILAAPPRPLAPGLFDYRTYLARQGIYYQLRAGSPADWRMIAPALAAPPFTARFLTWARQTLARGLPQNDEPLRLIWAMALGWKTALTGNVTESFMRSGTMHIFAISGLHIALIAGILVTLLRVLQLPRLACGIVVVPLLWFYTAATGWQPSAVRSTVMMTVIIGGWALRRPTDLLNSLAAAAFIILLWAPQQLFQASFQLSFFVVLSIALFLPPLEKLRDRLLQPDPLLPPELLPRWQRLSRPVFHWTLTCLATSLAAWLGSLPLTAFYFHLFSPVTLLANLVIVPLSGCALMCNLGSLLCGGWLPWVNELFNHCGWFWMLLMIKTTRWATELPGAFYYVPPPSPLTFVVYYALLIGTLSGWLLARERRGRVVLAMTLLVAFYGWRAQHARQEIELTVLPLNGGHSVFVNSPGTKNDWLIDCGNTNSVAFILKPFLRAQGVNRLPQLVLTHGDLQHVGGAEEINQAFRVPAVFTSAVRFRSPAYRRILGTLDRDGPARKLIQRGDEIGPWRVLHPTDQDRFEQADDGALVLLGNFHGTRVLLLSDLGRPGQNALLERTRDLRADIVITGLPVKTEPLCDALLDAVQPRVIIVADSEFPATERASPALGERLAPRGSTVLYTRQLGAVTICIRPEGWKIRSVEGKIIAADARGD